MYINRLNHQSAEKLISQGTIFGGIVIKVNAILRTAHQLRRSIVVAS
ncbi:MAG: hypothetical protein OXD32_01260 [Endozoicomonadaceae bacterium]|nr:hypothetical protein [Endozoicomonadaceae bacterium]MCY4329878.1 hypothetical protein [Endozoicomonadaceae bacterium]